MTFCWVRVTEDGNHARFTGGPGSTPARSRMLLMEYPRHAGPCPIPVTSDSKLERTWERTRDS